MLIHLEAQWGLHFKQRSSSCLRLEAQNILNITKPNTVAGTSWEWSFLVAGLIPLQWTMFSFSGCSSSTPLAAAKPAHMFLPFPYMYLCCSCSFSPVPQSFPLLCLHNSVLLLGRTPWATLPPSKQKAQSQPLCLVWQYAKFTFTKHSSSNYPWKRTDFWNFRLNLAMH